MSLGANKAALIGAAGGAAAGDFYDYQIAKSVRLEGATPNYLEKDFAGAGDRKTWTFSIWVKRSLIDGNNQVLLSSFNGSGSEGLWFKTDDVLDTNTANGGAEIITNALYRDISAWYHVVWRYDTTQAVDTNRERLYINGTLQTLSYAGYPSLNNAAGQINNAGNCEIGRHIYNTRYPFSGYFAEIVFIDGTSLGPDSFGETKNGVWIPKDPSGLTFGGNGYWLDMADNTAFGNDVSGNNNDWTSQGFATTDQMLDTPTFDSDTNAGNFCTFNPLNQGAYIALSEGNLRTAGASSADGGRAAATMAAPSGKWYWECVLKAVNQWIPSTGIRDLNSGTAMMDANQGPDRSITLDPAPPGGVYILTTAANNVNMGTVTVDQTGITDYASDDILSIALDLDNRKIWYAKNNVWWNSGDPAAGTNPQASWSADDGIAMTPWCAQYNTSSSYFNFGADASFAGDDTGTAGPYADATGFGSFYYEPPTDFLALCAGNLPTPAADPAADTGPYKYFVPKLYTGDGATTLAITGLEFQPDFTWIKNRDAADGHCWFDSTRGVTKLLDSDSTAAEATDADTLKSWTSDGYTVGADIKVNTSGESYASWNMKANGGTTSTNTNGDIDSTVQVDATECFSIVTYTGTLDASGVQTVGHGLSKAPNFIITKGVGLVSNWWVLSDGQTSWNYGMNLNTNGGSTDKSANGSMSAPTATVFSTNYTDGLNDSEGDIAYCFANCDGYIHSGSYMANSDADGPYIYCGFEPAFVMIKMRPSGDNWAIWDRVRGPFNVVDNILFPSTSAAESTNAYYNVDLLSNGFKCRSGNAQINHTSYDPYIYLAIAHNPFKYATAR